MRRPSGFPNEVLLSWDQDELKVAHSAEPSAALELTDIGFFPRAEGHFRSRYAGCGQNIVLVCLEGRGFLRLGGHREQILVPGDVGFIPRGMPHEYGASAELPWTIQWVHFRGGETKGPPGASSLPEGLFTRARDQFGDLLALATRGSHPPSVRAALAWWLELVLGRLPLVDPGLEQPAGPVALAVKGMMDHLDEPLSLERIAAWASLSPSWFTAVFRRETGVSPMAHLTRLRIQKACSLLERSDQPVNEVARAVGYPDPLHFSRVFRQRTGVSPTQWRASPRG